MIDYGEVAPTVDVCATLQSVECLDALGQRSVGARSDMDPTFA
jgi:hypothetical protein